LRADRARAIIVMDVAPATGRSAMDAKDTRKAEPLLLAIQFLVCVGCWTVVVLALEGTVSRSGFVASLVTGVVLVVITLLLIKLGWILAPAKPAEIAADEER
jgi:hypothetical protein